MGNTHNYFAGGLGAWVHNAGNNCAKGLIGIEFEAYLHKFLPGGKSVGTKKSPTGSRDIDASYIKNGKEVWVEAKSGKYWENIASTPEGLAKFKSDMGRGKKVSDHHGKPYELHSNTPIPDHIKDWLTEKGINYVEY